MKPYDDTDPDYHVLNKAYEHMIEDNFARFVAVFVAAGRNLNPAIAREKALSHVRKHRRSAHYAAILEKSGRTIRIRLPSLPRDAHFEFDVVAAT